MSDGKWIGIMLVIVIGIGVVLMKSSPKTPTLACSKINQETIQFTGNGFAAFDAKEPGKLCVWQNQEAGWGLYSEPNGNSLPQPVATSSTN